MRKLLCLLPLLALTARATTPSQFNLRSVPLQGVSLVDYGADPTGTSDCSAAFAAAFAALSSGGVLYLQGLSAGSPAVYKLTSNLIVPAGVTLSFDNASLNLTSTLLTINGSVKAPVAQTIFTYSGSAVAGCDSADEAVNFNGPQDSISAIWFGADPTDTVDSSPAIQMANHSVCGTYGLYGANPRSVPEIFFPVGVYKISESIGFPLVMRGEDSILAASSSSVNILTNIGFFGKFTGLTFVGGNNAMGFNEYGGVAPDAGPPSYTPIYTSGVTSNVWIQNDQFVNQTGAALSADATCANGFISVRDSWFESSASTSTMVTALSGTIEMHDNNASPGGTTVFQLADTDLYATDMSMAPTTADGQWIAVTGGGTYSFVRDRFGGEVSGKSVVKWTAPVAVASLFQEVIDTSLTVEDCGIYSDGNAFTFAFYDLPTQVRIRGNQGIFGTAFYFDPGIPVDERQQIPSIFQFTDIAIGDTLKSGVANQSSAEVVDRYRAFNTGSSSQPAVTDLQLAFGAGNNVYGKSTASTGQVCGTSVDGYGVATLACAADGGPTNSSVVAFTTALAGLPAGPYSAVLGIDTCSAPAQIVIGINGMTFERLVQEGQSVIDIPFYKGFADPSEWAINSTYDAGVATLSTDASDIWQALTTGESASSGSGPTTGSPGATFVDNAVTWEWIGNLAISMQAYNLPNPNGITYGRIRVFASHPAVTTQNTIGTGSALPVPDGGPWYVGDEEIFTNPADGGFFGAVYTAAGWKTFGVISP